MRCFRPLSIRFHSRRRNDAGNEIERENLLHAGLSPYTLNVMPICSRARSADCWRSNNSPSARDWMILTSGLATARGASFSPNISSKNDPAR